MKMYYLKDVINLVYLQELQINKANASDTETQICISIYLFRTGLFHLKFMIKEMSLIFT